MKSSFDNELAVSMRQELCKQASVQQSPNLIKAAECLHGALEILEGAGMQSKADAILGLLTKIAQTHKTKAVHKMPSIHKLMEAGITSHDLREMSKGSPIAKAKFNVVLRGMGMSDHEIGQFLGPQNVMSDKDAIEVANPNRSYGKFYEWIKDPTSPTNPEKIRPGETLLFTSKAKDDWHTKGLTPAKEVANIKHHGTPFNMADDSSCGVSVPPRTTMLAKNDMDADFVGLLDSPSFDIDASDDELMGMEVKEDSLEVSDREMMSDFEDERG